MSTERESRLGGWIAIAAPPPTPGAQWWVKADVQACVGYEHGRWHLSVSVAGLARYPTWDEIADARYSLLHDGLDMAMMLPPRGDYVNMHHVFHLWEIHDRKLPIERGSDHPRTLESGALA